MEEKVIEASNLVISCDLIHESSLGKPGITGMILIQYFSEYYLDKWTTPEASLLHFLFATVNNCRLSTDYSNSMLSALHTLTQGFLPSGYQYFIDEETTAYP